MKIGAGGIAAAALMAMATFPASAASYSGLYVFGDSLVDSGNAFLGTSGAAANPTDGYYQGRFSNGLNFADYLAQYYTGSVPKPAFVGGTNAAVGGALAAQQAVETSPSFLNQITFFQNFVSTSIPNDALVLVTFGGNDVRATAQTGGTVSFAKAVSDFTTGLDRLYAAGARNFVITGLPDISLLPSARPLAAIPNRLTELQDRSHELNYLLYDDAMDLAGKAGTSVSFFDLYAFEHNLLADPTAFGLAANLDTTTPCQIVGGGVPQIANCANSLYFDGIHPTTQIHQVIARQIEQQLAAVPEPASWALAILGFGMTGMALRRRTVGVRFG